MHHRSWRRTTRKITDIEVRKALAYAYPYESDLARDRRGPGRDPGARRTRSCLPGMAGKPDYFADGEQFTFNPDQVQGAPGRGRLRAR